MNINELVSQIQKEDCKTPVIGIVTPEIRSIDEKVQSVKVISKASDIDQ